MGTSVRTDLMSSPMQLSLECEEEPLSAAQKAYFEKRKAQFRTQMKDLKRLTVRSSGMSFQSESTVISVPDPVPQPPQPPQLPQPPIQAPVPPMINPMEQSKYRIILDPKTGRILGTIDSDGTPTPSGNCSNPTMKPWIPPTFRGVPGGTTIRPSVPSVPIPRPPVQRIIRSVPPSNLSAIPKIGRPPLNQSPKTAPPALLPLQTPASKGTPFISLAAAKKQPQPPPPPALPAPRLKAPVSSSPAPRLKAPVSSTPAPKAAPPPPVLEGPIPATLLIMPKSLKIVPQYHAVIVRKRLDSKVKGLLVRTPAKFTEYLIRQSLVPTSHSRIFKGANVDLKLGIYSDMKRNENSGGYVWMNEEEPGVFYSVFEGSIFNDPEVSPVTALKLIYHWSCQTSISNVVQWVRVSVAVVDRYFRLFRTLCTLFESGSTKKFGGMKKKVQVGVISLGTTSDDGIKKEVKVEVLGVLEVDSGRIRLRATVPRPGSTTTDRFRLIFRSLPDWIKRTSVILTDYSVDLETIQSLGFTHVQQQQQSGGNTKSVGGNSIIMDYLKRIVPKMFQSNLSKLTPEEIQQFLDELTFRETGYHPLLCFDNMVKQIAVYTKVAKETSLDIMNYLNKAEKDPFKARLPSSKEEALQIAQEEEKEAAESRKRPASPIFDAEKNSKLAKTRDLVDLQTFFYGSIPGDTKVLREEFKADMAFKCTICRKIYFNNIDFMKHLSLHAENDRASEADLLDMSQCLYCNMNFETPDNLKIHVDLCHLKIKHDFLCQICTEEFQWENHLIYHMINSHLHCELPYGCNICGYRSSNHVELINHFHREHDRTDKIICPKCLKVYSLMGDKGYNSSVTSAFLSHLKSHSKGKSFDCATCNLSFFQEAYLKAHESKDHSSYHKIPGFQTYQYAEGETRLQLSRPMIKTSRIVTKKTLCPIKSQAQTSFAAQNYEDMLMYNVYKENCCECRKKLSHPGHFSTYLCCTQCRYSTCCARAMSIHNTLFHSQAQPVFDLGVPSMLQNKMYCICGFKSYSGNKLAKHLSRHGCRTAYLSKKQALGASTSRPAPSDFEGASSPYASSNQETGMDEDEKEDTPLPSPNSTSEPSNTLNKDTKAPYSDEEEEPMILINTE